LEKISKCQIIQALNIDCMSIENTKKVNEKGIRFIVHKNLMKLLVQASN
jgi:hypothetical protein